jgi:hypothetical protein
MNRRGMRIARPERFEVMGGGGVGRSAWSDGPATGAS